MLKHTHWKFGGVGQMDARTFTIGGAIAGVQCVRWGMGVKSLLFWCVSTH